VTLIVIHCNDLTVTKFRMYTVAAVLRASMKVCSVPCHDRGHINVMLVLQSCTDPLHILPGLSSVTYATSCDISTVKVEEDVDAIEEVSIAINEEVDISIKQEEIPKDTTSPGIRSESVEVSYVCVCVWCAWVCGVCVCIIRHILPVSRNVSFFFLC